MINESLRTFFAQDCEILKLRLVIPDYPVLVDLLLLGHSNAQSGATQKDTLAELGPVERSQNTPGDNKK